MSNPPERSERIFNFSAGPAVLPEPVLEEAREALWNLDGSGIGVLEHSHRGKVFDAVRRETEAALRRLGGFGDDFAVLFLQGGASLQFAMLPANLLPADRSADYLVTGSWGKKAVKEAKLYGGVHVAASTEEDGFDHIPEASAIRYGDAPVYVHFTSNNTIFGTEWPREPEVPEGAFLACDASSDVFSRPLDAARYGVLYAGAQKNLGPAGVTLVVIRRELLERRARELPSMLRYDVHADNDSCYNTPNTFGIYLMGRVAAWIEAQGGLEAMARRNEEKAAIVYDAIDADDFYSGTVRPDSRSRMSVTFRTPSPELDARFVEEATAAGLDGLKGHRSVGGMRASLYNAFPKEGCEALARFMKDFAAKNG